MKATDCGCCPGEIGFGVETTKIIKLINDCDRPCSLMRHFEDISVSFFKSKNIGISFKPCNFTHVFCFAVIKAIAEPL